MKKMHTIRPRTWPCPDRTRLQVHAVDCIIVVGKKKKAFGKILTKTDCCDHQPTQPKPATACRTEFQNRVR
jgi:hypothetical protein